MKASPSQRFVGVWRSVPVDRVLRAGPERLQVAWLDAARGERAVGLGVAGEGGGDVRWAGPPPPLDPPGPWFGGWAFDDARAWSGFPAERWVLPAVLVWQGRGQVFGAAFGREGGDTAPLSRALDRLVEGPPPIAARAAAVEAGAARAKWQALVERALQAIAQGGTQKIVVARELRVGADHAFDERAVLEALAERQRGCHVFAFRGTDDAVFLGATPELLLDVRGGHLTTEALAGSAPPGAEATLRASPKDLAEHQFVVDALEQRLAPYVAGLERPAAPAIKALTRVIHLHTPMRAALREGVDAVALARVLHPTPAVCGTPTDAARAWLRAHEGFERGWYTGVVAARGPASFTAFVALRSSLLRNREAIVFAGAGIVRGSDPNAEWEETERKARAMMDGLGVETHG